MNSIHILDLLFGPTQYKADEKKRGYKDEDEMWERRLETKERLNSLAK